MVTEVHVNIAGDDVEARDYVLSLNAVPAIVTAFNSMSRLSTIRNAAWTMSNLCRGKPSPDFAVIRPLLIVLTRLILSEDMETVVDAMWALSYMSDGSNDRIQEVIDSGICPRIVELLGVQIGKYITPVLRTVGNIVTGTDSQTQHLISLNILPALLHLLDNPTKNICKEAVWTISNITAGTIEQIQAVIDANIIPKLAMLLQSAHFAIQKVTLPPLVAFVHTLKSFTYYIHHAGVYMGHL